MACHSNSVFFVHYRSDLMTARNQKSIDLIYLGRSDHLDVVLLHSPRCWWSQCSSEMDSFPWQVAWKNLEAEVEAGRVSSIGVSNFNTQQLSELLQIATYPVSFVQNWMDPLHQDREVCTLS